MVASMVYHGKIQCLVVLPWYRLLYHGTTIACMDFYYGSAISWYTMLGSWVAYSVVNLTLINAIQIFHSLTADGSTQVS